MFMLVHRLKMITQYFYIVGKALGKRISEMLQEQGIQQKELAERIGITETAMSRYINGTREPKPDVIANMATALHTTSDYLLGITDDPAWRGK